VHTGGDLDLDRDARIVPAEAAERSRQEVHAGGGRCAEADRPGLQAGEGGKLLVRGPEGGERLRGAPGQDPARLGQAAAATVALDEALARGGLEQPQMLARAGLADADRLRGRREAPAPLDLDQQAHAVRVPELRSEEHT